MDKNENIKKSLVKVSFEHSSYEPIYYNDKFNIEVGDKVYVDGKFEDKIGTVIEVNYNFKIKTSEYKKVIAVADTSVKGLFSQHDFYMTTFDSNALPPEKVKLWFNSPLKENDEVISCSDGKSFELNKMKESFDEWTTLRGISYHKSKNVLYFHFENNHIYAIVEGSKNYEIEFDYRDGVVSNLMCSCFCTGNCKHEYAALLMLQDMLKLIEKHSKDLCPPKNITTIRTDILFNYTIMHKKEGITISL